MEEPNEKNPDVEGHWKPHKHANEGEAPGDQERDRDDDEPDVEGHWKPHKH